jgi:sugar/nucleoside kinase (ribokinase family)
MSVSGSSLIFIGHISRDCVRNPWGERIQIGGAALYAAIAAKALSRNVRIVTAVGRDFTQMDFLRSMFPGSAIRRVNLPSTYFEIDYDRNFSANYKTVRLGAGASIKVSDLPKHWIREDAFIHLAPMNPSKVERFVEVIRKVSPKTWVSAHTSPDYLRIPSNRRILRRVAEEVDLFVTNDHEALRLSGTSELTSAMRTLKSRRLAVTLGQWGAILVDKSGIQMIPALNTLITNPKDTTGAGDTWCGALLSSYAMTREWTKSVVTACLISALKCMGWNIEKVKDLRFESPDQVIEHVLKLKDGSIQLSLKDFAK